MTPRQARVFMLFTAGACITPLTYYWILTDWWVFPFLIAMVFMVLIAWLIANRG